MAKKHSKTKIIGTGDCELMAIYDATDKAWRYYHVLPEALDITCSKRGGQYIAVATLDTTVSDDERKQ